uniref:Uncharacterized protein n=1 Tax=Oryza rufipogon TaxID=4529 RepID=A0A0E0NZ88_ORYRU
MSAPRLFPTSSAASPTQNPCCRRRIIGLTSSIISPSTIASGASLHRRRFGVVLVPPGSGCSGGVGVGWSHEAQQGGILSSATRLLMLRAWRPGAQLAATQIPVVVILTVMNPFGAHMGCLPSMTESMA